MTERVALEFTLTLGPPVPPSRPVLRDVKITETGAVSFAFDGDYHRAYRVQKSEDLQTWTEIGVPSQPAPGLYQFTDPDGSTLPRRFYRVLAD